MIKLLTNEYLISNNLMLIRLDYLYELIYDLLYELDTFIILDKNTLIMLKYKIRAFKHYIVNNLEINDSIFNHLAFDILIVSKNYIIPLIDNLESIDYNSGSRLILDVFTFLIRLNKIMHGVILRSVDYKITTDSRDSSLFCIKYKEKEFAEEI